MKKIIILLATMSCWSWASQAENPLTGTFTQQITSIAAGSNCAQYNWQARGVAPPAYIVGVALTFARSVCRLQSAASAAAQLMSEADTGNTATDAISWYRGIFNNDGMVVDVNGISTMRADYVLGIGDGMRESSGAYCTGWDTSAGSNRPGYTGEAGLFQVSYDGFGATPELASLYSEYQADTSRCLLDAFSQGVTCPAQGPLGTGVAADFQTFSKNCPAFATEYAMTLFRVLRSFSGPINRYEAEVQPTCDSMLQQVQTLVQTNAGAACAELF